MQIRRTTLAILAATVVTGIVAGSAAPAFADDDWRWHQRHEWREHEGREHEWRHHEWREHEWRRHHYPPPFVVRHGYPYRVPPPVYYGGPAYYR